jgi:hypothetical protein
MSVSGVEAMRGDSPATLGELMNIAATAAQK